MPFSMKIQPVDFNKAEEAPQTEPVKQVVKSRLKRLFERQFPSVLRNSASEKAGLDELHSNKDGAEFEPSSLCLAKMVQNFIEDNDDKQSTPARWGRNRCNCFNGNCTDISEEEFDGQGGFWDSNFSFSVEVCELLKGLVPCASVSERNLLADTARIVEKNKFCKRKDDVSRKTVADGLLALKYDASVCKSRWEKAPSYPAGDYEYIDVIVEGGERLLIDLDFRSEFEIARSTKTYKAILQALPVIFVGKADRLQRIISIVSEAAKQSLKKKGMHIPPWRTADYFKAKWLSLSTRTPSTSVLDADPETVSCLPGTGEFTGNSVDGSVSSQSALAVSETCRAEEEKATVVNEWKPPDPKPKSSKPGVRIVTGLASVFENEP